VIIHIGGSCAAVGGSDVDRAVCGGLMWVPYLSNAL
jgi:hypothetical protein